MASSVACFNSTEEPAFVTLEERIAISSGHIDMGRSAQAMAATHCAACEWGVPSVPNADKH